MPTTSLMQFSAPETDNDGANSVRSMSGISSKHFLKMIEDGGRTGFWSWDLATSHLTVSVGIYRLLGLDPSTSLQFTDWMTMLHPDDRAQHSDMQALIQSGLTVNREFRVIRPDQTLRWIQIKAEAMVDAKGRPARCIGLMIDVTEEHDARMSVEQGWQSYNGLVSAIADVTWRLLPNGEIISLQSETPGQPGAEATKDNWLKTIHPDDREALREKVAVNHSSAHHRSVEIRIRGKDGLHRRYVSRAGPIFNPDGTLREWIGILVATESGTPDKGATVLHTAETLEIAHIRAGRALLNWSSEDLAAKSGVSISTIRRLELGAVKSTRARQMDALRTAFEAAGVAFAYGLDGETTISLARRPEIRAD